MHDDNNASVDEPNPARPVAFGITLDVVNGETIVGLQGELDIGTAPELEAIASKLLEQRHLHVVIELSHVRFIDAAGLRVISRTARRLSEHGGTLHLRAPSPFVAELLSLVGMAGHGEPAGPPPDTTEARPQGH